VIDGNNFGIKLINLAQYAVGDTSFRGLTHKNARIVWALLTKAEAYVMQNPMRMEIGVQ
jgi:hypothetical protein